MNVASLSVFFPAFNEEDNIARTITEAKKVLVPLKIPWEIIVVDDGSFDGTAREAVKTSQGDKRIRVISQKNGGYGAALQTGFKEAKYDWIVYTDADGQFDFNDLHRFLELAKSYDAIWGFRMKRNDPWYRALFARVWRISVLFLFHLPLRDLDCGFKLIKKSVIEQVLPLRSRRGAMINVELAAKIIKKGFRLGEVGVPHRPRQFGTPTGFSLPVIIMSYLDLVRLRFVL